MSEKLKKMQDIFEDILDIDPEEVSLETYVIRELDAESIDLLEMAVAINSEFKVDVEDENIFLKYLRDFITGDDEATKTQEILKQYPFLKTERIKEILEDLKKWPCPKS
jgi:acyl carrier protein